MMRALLIVGITLGFAGCPDKEANVSQADYSEVFIVDQNESLKRGYPNVGLQVQASGMGLSEAQFANPGEIVHLSGPPGGPLGFYMWIVNDTPATAEQLSAWAKKHFDGRDLELGEGAELELGQHTVPVQTATTDKSNARAHHMLGSLHVDAGDGDVGRTHLRRAEELMRRGSIRP